MIALEPRAAGHFMQRLGPAIEAGFGRPRAILVASAHSLTREPVLMAAARHEAMYDFGGFDPRLYEMRYDAPGAPALAGRVAGLLQAAGIAVAPRRRRRAGPWHLDAAALPVSRRRRAGAAPGLAAAVEAGAAVRARPGAGAAGRRRRADPGQRQHHAQPAARLRRRRPAPGRQPAHAREHGLPRLVRRAQRRPPTGTRCSTTARGRRTRPSCTRPTSTCCPSSWPPVRAAAGRRGGSTQSLEFGDLGMDAYAFGTAGERLQGAGEAAGRN